MGEISESIFRPIIYVPDDVLDFRYLAPFRNGSASKATRPIFALSALCKIRAGVRAMSESIFRAIETQNQTADILLTWRRSAV